MLVMQQAIGYFTLDEIAKKIKNAKKIRKNNIKFKRKWIRTSKSYLFQQGLELMQT